MYKRSFTLFEAADYANSNPTGISYTAGEPSSGQYTYYSATRIVKVNSTRGYFRPYLGRVFAGDIIRIRADIYSISGVIPSLAIDLGTTLAGAEVWTSGLLRGSKTAEWETLTLQAVMPYDATYMSIVAGLISGETGVYEIRDITIEIESIGSGKETVTQLESTIAAGSAPLVVASTTKVTNLNADQVDGQDIVPWTNWTPTIGYAGGTTDPTSSTIVQARYMQIGKLVNFYIRVNFVRGSGDRTQVNFTLPVNRHASYTATMPFPFTHSLATKGYNDRAFSDSADKVKCETSAMTADGYIAVEGFYEAA